MTGDALRPRGQARSLASALGCASSIQDQVQVDRQVRIARKLSWISGPLVVAGSLLVVLFFRHCEVHPIQLVGLVLALSGRFAAALAVGRCVRLWRAGVHPPYAAAALAVLVLLL